MLYFDWWIMLVVIGLMAFGSVMSFSASAGITNVSPTSFLQKQLFFYGIALALMLMCFHLSRHWVKILGVVSWAFYLISMALMLLAVLFPPINGARGWIVLGPISIQPVEIYKVTIILWMSFAMTRKNHTLKDNFIHLGWIRIIMSTVLLYTYPDMGGIIITLGILFIIVLSSGAKARYAVGSLGAVLVIWWALIPAFEPWLEKFGYYMMQRFTAYLNPWKYAQTIGNQLINSYYAVSNGGLFGRGIGRSLQKTGNLPEPNTDFIMAVVSEELGAVAIMIVLAALLFVVWRLVYFAFQTGYMRFRLILVGTAAYIMLQIIVNLGGVIGILPITGVTFPFISVGGSSIISLGLALGLSLNVIKHIRSDKAQQLLQA